MNALYIYGSMQRINILSQNWILLRLFGGRITSNIACECIQIATKVCVWCGLSPATHYFQHEAEIFAGAKTQIFINTGTNRTARRAAYIANPTMLLSVLLGNVQRIITFPSVLQHASNCSGNPLASKVAGHVGTAYLDSCSLHTIFRMINPSSD